VLQALDTEVRNANHEAIAALAADGYVRAVVTINFDRLIERALTASAVQYQVFYDVA
jgi:NAD-dependent SIR2 family protein deacetylase